MKSEDVDNNWKSMISFRGQEAKEVFISLNSELAIKYYFFKTAKSLVERERAEYSGILAKM